VVGKHVVDELEPLSMAGGLQHTNQEEALVSHRTARLNVFGRQLLVSRVELDGWAVAKAAERRTSAARRPISG